MNKMRNIKIGITGVNPFDGNRGVGALSYSIVHILRNISKQTGDIFEIYYIINGTSMERACVIDLNGELVKVNILKEVNIFMPKLFLKLIIFFRDFITYLKLDYILDSGYGDSYSDIYGVQNFNYHNSSKRFFSLLRKKQMLLPQTIGPFFSAKVKNDACKAMSHMQVLLGRDTISYDFVKQNVPTVISDEIIDMAFFMPYTRDTTFVNTTEINIGLGISKLLWNKGLNGTMSYTDDYQQLMRRIIEHFLDEENVHVYLVPHVVNQENSNGNDYELCYNLVREYNNPKLTISPFFIDPIKAKNFISSLDFFAGSRMHACIASFSSGVPVFPISYSQKFIGLFNRTLDYQNVGDLTSMKNDEIFESLIKSYENRQNLTGIIKKKNQTIVKDRYELFVNYLTSFFNS